MMPTNVLTAKSRLIGIALVSVAAMLMAAPVHATGNQCESLRARLTSLPPGQKISRPESDIDRLVKERVCMKSYPWPKGEDFGAGDAVAADRMLQIKLQVDTMAVDFKALAPEAFVKKYATGASGIQQVRQFAGNKWDMNLLTLYGDLLYVMVLLGEGRFSDIASYIERTPRLAGIKPVAAPWDKADENTYFSKETLHKMITAIKFIAIARTNAKTTEHALRDADAFLSLRNILGEEIKTLGNNDPGDDLLERAGCY